jgi:hypothetical protein
MKRHGREYITTKRYGLFKLQNQPMNNTEVALYIVAVVPGRSCYYLFRTLSLSELCRTGLKDWLNGNGSRKRFSQK